jgi:isoleucyl-tRNA synthetase
MGPRQEAGVFFAEYQSLSLPADSEALMARWERLLTLRTVANQTLEAQRKAGTIGAFLDAELHLYANSDWQEFLHPYAGELRFLLLSSGLHLHLYAERPADCLDSLPGLAMTVEASTAAKCARCWHRRPDVGRHAEHPLLCGRCIENLAEPGETREIC